MKFFISKEFKSTIKNNWGTIDAFEFIVEESTVKNIIFYEIKTTRFKDKIPVVTSNSLRFHKQCLVKGLIVKTIVILLKHNWNYEMIEKDFD